MSDQIKSAHSRDHALNKQFQMTQVEVQKNFPLSLPLRVKAVMELTHIFPSEIDDLLVRDEYIRDGTLSSTKQYI
ncbi:hypothetical protein D3C87_1687000 [compost metagenome]